ncbi:MAG: hypothetical protein ACJ79S_06120 [Gemmatimonadaceae bacterium]
MRSSRDSTGRAGVASAVAAGLAVALAAGCATPAVVRRIESAHPGASYDAAATGCDWRVRSRGRHFGRDLRGAWLWSRQVVGGAQARQCEVVIEAVSGGTHEAVYRIARDSLGRRTESVVFRP